MLIPNKAIVFDLDDTLYPEMDFLKSGYRYIAQRISDSPDTLYPLMLEKYNHKADVFGYLEREYHIEKSQLLDWYRHHEPEIELYTGVKDFLEAFRSKYQFAIITDGRSMTQRHKIKALGLDKYIDMIVISEEIGSEKPNIANYKKVQDSLNCDAYCYIADNVKKDFITPNLLGWLTVCLIDQGNNIHSQDFSVTNDFLPNQRFHNWQEIHDFFHTINYK